MKKLLLSAFTLMLIGGCEEKVQLTPKEEKTNLVELVYAEEENAIKKHNKIKTKLTEQAKKGNKDAMEELEKWKEREEHLSVVRMSKESKAQLKKKW